MTTFILVSILLIAALVIALLFWRITLSTNKYPYKHNSNCETNDN